MRSLRNAALEDYFAIEENRTAAQLLLVSEVANAWLTLIADRELLQLADDTRDSQRKSYDLTKLRFDQGVSSEIDLHRSESPGAKPKSTSRSRRGAWPWTATRSRC